MPKRDTQAAQDRRKNKKTEKRLFEESQRLERERIKREEELIRQQQQQGVFKGAKGGILKMRSGGKIDGLAMRGKTKGRYV